MRQTEALESLNRVIDEWNSHQQLLLSRNRPVATSTSVRTDSDDWQRFRAFDVELSVDDGPFGFGRTRRKSGPCADLVNNSYCQRSIDTST